MHDVDDVIPNLQVFYTEIFTDARGYFLESFRAQLPQHRIYVQDNESYSKKRVLRGLHFQKQHPQAKLVRVVAGRILDVVVDLRACSAGFGKWIGLELWGADVETASPHPSLYVPAGCAHGFVVLSDRAIVQYKCTDFYYPKDQHGVKWDDPELNITWDKYCPAKDVIVSEQDKAWPSWSQVRKELIREQSDKEFKMS